jgi:hypothetical protein
MLHIHIRPQGLSPARSCRRPTGAAAKSRGTGSRGPCGQQASVKSDWVRTVASMALADGKLIPVKTDDLSYDQIPFPFADLHTESIGSLKGIEAAVRERSARQERELRHWRETEASPRRAMERVDRRRLVLALLLGISAMSGVLAYAFVALDETKVAGLLAKSATQAPPVPPSPLDVVDIDLFYRGDDLQGYPQLMQTSPECRRACARRGDCAGFSFVWADRLCYLKASIAGESRWEGTISGRTVRSPVPVEQPRPYH